MDREPDSVEVVTFGCRLNAFESEVMRQNMARAQWQDTVLINSCAVTAEAERQLRQTIRRLRRQRPEARIVVTGCAAQIDPGKYAAMAEVDRVIGNGEKLDPALYDQGPEGPAVMVSPMAEAGITAPILESFNGRSRAFVQAQQGCDHHCTFCIIPQGRGPNRSLPVGALVEQVRSLVATGFKEVVLSGVDLTSYGDDLPGRPRLGELVRRLLRLVPDLPRLRLSSLDPAAVDDGLLQIYGDDPRLLPHVHLSIQAGDDMVLKRMRRRHSGDDVRHLCDRLRRARPGMSLGADLIAGFPTETEEMFQRSEDLVRDCGIEFGHVFPYSPRQGTPAARMPQLPDTVRKERAARLRAATHANLDCFLTARLGGEARVLVEDNGQGRDEFYAPVRIATGAAAGALHRVRLVGRDGDMLIGDPLE